MNKEAIEQHIKLLQAVGVSAQDIDRERKTYAEKGWRGLDESELKWNLGEWENIVGISLHMGLQTVMRVWVTKTRHSLGSTRALNSVRRYSG